MWGRDACEVWGFVWGPDKGLEHCRRGRGPRSFESRCVTLADRAPGAVLSRAPMLEGVQSPWGTGLGCGPEAPGLPVQQDKVQGVP